MADTYFSVTNKTKGRLPRLPFKELKEKVLGKNYVLSLVLISDMKARALNKEHRSKNEPANILTFPLSKNEGEILISLQKIKKDAPSFDMNYKDFLVLIFIHGMLHLKGFTHGSTMEKKVEQLLSNKI